MWIYSLQIQSSCSHLMFIQWLQDHMLPCPFKYLTGIDCPGCGFQRSVLALVQGNFHQSLSLYPATIPLLLFFAYGIADRLIGLDNKKEIYKKTFYIIVGSIMLVSYIIKMYHLSRGYKVSI